jgi:hypothetical protein
VNGLQVCSQRIGEYSGIREICIGTGSMTRPQLRSISLGLVRKNEILLEQGGQLLDHGLGFGPDERRLFCCLRDGGLNRLCHDWNGGNGCREREEKLMHHWHSVELRWR